MWPFWYHFVAVLACGRFRLWPFRLWPFWYVAVLEVHRGELSSWNRAWLGDGVDEVMEFERRDEETTKMSCDLISVQEKKDAAVAKGED